MNYRPYQKGFTFFELMIAVAVVGILSIVAIPAYRGYINTANMTKVTASFEEGVRLATNTFARRGTRVALGIQTTIPDTTEGWIQLLNPKGSEAPGGGPAFIPSSNQSGEKGDALTGAIGVRWLTAMEARASRPGGTGPGSAGALALWRPLYSDLAGQYVIITEDNIQIEKFSN